MRKRAILALLLVVVLAMTASCKLIVKDAEVDRQTVIAEVAGQQIIKQDVETEVASVMNMQAYYYYQYGLNYDPADSKNIQAARNTAVENLILDIVLKQKEQEMGIALTDEEIAALQTELDTTYAGYVDTIRTSYFAESELTGEELDTAVMQMTEQMYGTKDALLESKKAEAVYQKLKDTVVADVAVTDEEVQNEYNAGVTTAMENYGTNLPAYGQAVRAGSTVYYVPAGYRYVKNLLVLLDEEDSTAISDLSTQLSDANTQLTSVNTAMAALPEDATTDTEDQAASREGLVTQKAELEAKVADLSAQLTQRQDAAYAKKQPIIDEVLAKLAAGESFDALVEQYGEDTGMKASPAKEQGYLVCQGDTQYVTEFTTAAMQLAKVGDVSAAPVRTSYGLHLLQYASDVTPGAVPLDDLCAEVSEQLLTSKQNNQFNATTQQWVDESGAKIYMDRMN